MKKNQHSFKSSAWKFVMPRVIVTAVAVLMLNLITRVHDAVAQQAWNSGSGSDKIADFIAEDDGYIPHLIIQLI